MKFTHRDPAVVVNSYLPLDLDTYTGESVLNSITTTTEELT